MPTELSFTGERFVPGTAGEIAFEHWHRYAFARRFVAGRRVLDVACGEGYGTALLAEVAASVVGIDVDPSTIEHSRRRYGATGNVTFECGSVVTLPLPDASVDAIVSFETIEHVANEDQRRMLAEFDRVLAPRGALILSSPNRPQYSDARGYANPFHVHELDRHELEHLLDAHFHARRWYRQHRLLSSALWAEAPEHGYEILAGDHGRVAPAHAPEAMYFVVIAARDRADLPQEAPALSLFADTEDREWTRLDQQGAEVQRLDALLGERDAALDAQTAHIRHLEELVAYRERIVVERDGQLVEVNSAREAAETSLQDVRSELERVRRELREYDVQRQQREQRLAELDAQCAQRGQRIAELDAQRVELEGAVTAQERIIAYRASARWWLLLPWLRMRGLWDRLRAS